MNYGISGNKKLFGESVNVKGRKVGNYNRIKERTVRLTLEKRKVLYVAFMDLGKVYDKICREVTL